jgi:AraC-like DNA-binding protein
MPSRHPAGSGKNYSFGLIQSAAEEVRTDPSYAFDNQHRPDGSGLVVQLTLSGVAYFREDGRKVLVKPEYAMLFGHDESTAYGYPPEAREPYRHIYVEFSDCPAQRTIFNRIREDFGAIVHVPERSEARDLIDEIVKRFSTGHFADRYQESELLYRLLVAIYRQQIEGTKITDPIEFGFHMIRNRFRKSSNIKEISQQCGVTREYFTREFQRRYHLAPSQLLKQLRLEHAELLLKTTKMPVGDVSAASGFSDQSTFARLFKKRIGCSPDAFRRRRAIAAGAAG